MRWAFPTSRSSLTVFVADVVERLRRIFEIIQTGSTYGGFHRDDVLVNHSTMHTARYSVQYIMHSTVQ